MNILGTIFNSTKAGIGFSKEDVVKIITGAAINAAGVALVVIVEQIAQLNWGLTAPIVTGASIVLVNVIRKFLPAVK